MEDFKTYFIIEKLLKNGYSEENAKEEMQLHKALRATDNLHLFKLICSALGGAGGLLGVPTLMAYAIENGPKAEAAQTAIDAIKNRVQKDSKKELKDFFLAAYWKPIWVASKEKFISYVACLNGLLSSEDFFEGELMDELGEKLVKEMAIDLSPYQSFKEMRLCLPEVDTEEELTSVLINFSNEIMLETAIADASITINSDSQLDENIVNMQCDYLLTRLNLQVDDDQFRLMLKAASVLNQP